MREIKDLTPKSKTRQSAFLSQIVPGLYFLVLDCAGYASMSQRDTCGYEMGSWTEAVGMDVLLRACSVVPGTDIAYAGSSA